jgi:hypothetical protein
MRTSASRLVHGSVEAATDIRHHGLQPDRPKQIAKRLRLTAVRRSRSSVRLPRRSLIHSIGGAAPPDGLHSRCHGPPIIT